MTDESGGRIGTGTGRRLPVRRLLLPVIFLAELALLLGLSLPSPTARPVRDRGARVFVLAADTPVAAEVARVTPPAPIVVPPPIVRPPPPDIPPPIAVAPPVSPAAATSSSGDGCDVNGPMLAALTQAPAVAAAIAAIPPSARAVANVVQLWTGDGILAGMPDRSAPAAVFRTVIATTLAALPADCASQPRRGPAFFLLRIDGQDVAIVIGSGEWTWQQVVAPDPPPEDQARNIGDDRRSL